MATFQHSYPEQQASHDPLMAGQQAITGTELPKFRLEQLRHLARAFQVQMDMDAPKQDILPVLMAAERSGVFRGKPANMVEYQRAFWHQDDGPCPHGVSFEPTPVVVEKKTDADPSDMGWNELRSICREWYPDVKIYGRSREDVECLYRNGAFPEDMKDHDDVDSTDNA